MDSGSEQGSSRECRREKASGLTLRESGRGKKRHNGCWRRDLGSPDGDSKLPDGGTHLLQILVVTSEYRSLTGDGLV
ncbi:unnamed protein product [Lota lota]